MLGAASGFARRTYFTPDNVAAEKVTAPEVELFGGFLPHTAERGGVG